MNVIDCFRLIGTYRPGHLELAVQEPQRLLELSCSHFGLTRMTTTSVVVARGSRLQLVFEVVEGLSVSPAVLCGQ